MSSRLRFIDATRALFLVQGVVFHSLLPFHEAKRWVVSNPESLIGIAALTDWMHSFRMHGFFLISGLLSWRVLCRGSASGFLHSRFQRFLIPFTFVLLTANIVERWLISQHFLDWGWGPGSLDQLHVGALWFLAYLAAFTGALPLMRSAVADTRIVRWADRLSPTHIENCLPLLLMGGSALVAVMTRTSPVWWYSTQLGLIEPASALMYGGYFMAGAMLARTGSVAMLASRPSLWWWAATVVGWVLIRSVSDASFPGAWLLSSVLANAYAIAPLRLIFWGMSRVFEGGSEWSSSLVEASYTVYLLHHVVVVAAASMLAWVPWHPVLEIAIIVSLSLGLPLAFHHTFVKNSRWLAFLLNGEPLVRTRSSANRLGVPAQ